LKKSFSKEFFVGTGLVERSDPPLADWAGVPAQIKGKTDLLVCLGQVI